MLKAKSFNLRSFAVDVDVSCDVVVSSKFRESIFIHSEFSEYAKQYSLPFEMKCRVTSLYITVPLPLLSNAGYG